MMIRSDSSKAEFHRFELTFSIIAEAHFGLSETNCVFSLANAIKLFQLSLVDTLWI